MDERVTQTLRAIRPRLHRAYGIARVRVFDPATTVGEDTAVGILLDFEQTPGLFELGAIQAELERELGVSVSLAIAGMIKEAWEGRFEENAVDI